MGDKSAVGWIGRHSTSILLRLTSWKDCHSSRLLLQPACTGDAVDRTGGCNGFNAQVLRSFAVCPYCRFPEDSAGAANISGRILAIKLLAGWLWIAWESQIISEISNLKERMSLLSASTIAQELIQKGQLPDNISDDLLTALFELSSDLQSVELDLNPIGDYLLSRGVPWMKMNCAQVLMIILIQIIKGYNHDLIVSR